MTALAKEANVQNGSGSPIKLVPKREKPEVKRLNVNLPASKFENLQELSNRTGMSMTQLVRWGIGVVECLVDDIESGNKVLIVDPQGNPLKEVVIPM